MGLKTKNNIVINCGTCKSYVVIDNNLFFHKRTCMLFRNTKDTLQRVIKEVENIKTK